MKKKQWFTLAWLCMGMGIFFILIDTMNGSCLYSTILSSGPNISVSDVHCVINSEIYEPFIYFSYALWLIFIIMGVKEKKK
ncbi:hypothetical protein K8R33_01060 [archaeon]|nr:hypothetical protein [archaeon]